MALAYALKNCIKIESSSYSIKIFVKKISAANIHFLEHEIVIFKEMASGQSVFVT